jgi:uncharacterized protein (TIGR03000 family)
VNQLAELKSLQSFIWRQAQGRGMQFAFGKDRRPRDTATALFPATRLRALAALNCLLVGSRGGDECDRLALRQVTPCHAAHDRAVDPTGEKPMVNHWRMTPARISLVGVLLLLAAQPVLGQSADGYYYESFRYGYNPGYYARHYPVPSPEYYALYFGPYHLSASKTWPGLTAAGASVYYAPPISGLATEAGAKPSIRGRWPVRAESSEQTDTAVQLEFRVPEGAQVWLGGVQTQQTGSLRHYATPPLTPGQEYTYEARVAWIEHGKEMVQNQTFRLHAGEHVSVSFPAAVAQGFSAGAGGETKSSRAAP